MAVAMLVACGPSIGQPGDDASASSGDDAGSGSTDTSVGGDASVGPSPGPFTTASPTTATATDPTDPTDTSDPSVGDETTAGDATCPQSEAFTCSGSYGCGERGCIDEPMWSWDEHGCLRPRCPCDPGMVCFTPADWGGCAPSETSCEDDPVTGKCECGGTADCGGSYCLPEGEVPPVACGALFDEASCLDAGCTAFAQARPIVARGGGACLCDLEAPWCIFIAPGATALPGSRAYVNVLDDSVYVFEATWDPPPFGWVACSDYPFPPPECACAEVLPCAMGGG